ncbi:hypothetical protein EXIGLDRAFT_769464 [Exidia glandulosa HHB12029]|uniref:Reverse transcriptase domain-containing protein n=1 Tax=Exidia glandulosa HHB12029 TaxID=1314781 RepID=A0A165HH33_EXIGL|nr:hypothetical protein EXIGLDRAFT_769464 [Exidia glandulosa HHB12029]
MTSYGPNSYNAAPVDLCSTFTVRYTSGCDTAREGKEESELFAADMGILIGDPASPIMWLIYFADVHIPDCAGDIADDIVIFATSPAALQAKLESLYRWCSRALLRINGLKSWWMPLGTVPNIVPTFYLAGAVEMSAIYVGVKLTCSDRNMLALHHQQKADTAFTMSSILSTILDRQCLQVLPWAMRRIYTNVIEPHLLHACDVIPDTTKTAITSLERVQHTFLRRILRVGSSCSVVALFTETGLAPLRYRRADLLVRYLGYLLQRPEGSFARAAVDDSLALADDGYPGWYSDVQKALKVLPVPVAMGRVRGADDIDDLRVSIKTSLQAYLRAHS